jgi:hypothetical protein
VEFGGEIGNQREVELVDGIIRVIDLTQKMEVILNNDKTRPTNHTGEKGFLADNSRVCRDPK